MSHAPDLEPHKRKRDFDDNGGHHHHLAALQPGTVGLINYLPRPSAQRLALIQGDADTFADVISIITEYEAVLERNESLAAGLGAKLTGPRFLKGIENFFDGPIRINPSQAPSSPITWLDVVTFAKANPNGFTLVILPDGSRCSRFVCRGVQVEITEDDWRLISSGALDRLPLEHPFEEDETAELATLEILEQRSLALYKKADEVAARARILHHRLGQRRQDLARRHRPHDAGSGARFHAVNHPQRTSVVYGASSFDLHAELLQQFASAAAPIPVPGPASGPQSRSTSVAGLSVASLNPLSPRMEAPQHQQHQQDEQHQQHQQHQQRQQHQQYHRLSGQSGFSATSHPADTASTGSSQATTDSQIDFYRSLVMQRTDKLSKGETINPPCDRCRRLQLQCVKHLTACQGCTKKHAKCSWRAVTDEEVASLRHEMGIVVPPRRRESASAGVGRAPGAAASGVVMFEGASRPASRADTDIGVLMSFGTDALPSSGRPDPAPGPRRTSLPTERFGGGQPRDQSRMGQISSILSPLDYNHQPFVNAPNHAR